MKKSKLLSICLCFILLLSISIPVNATTTDNTDPLAPYKLELEKINIELGTSYNFVSEEELLTQTNYTVESLIEFYTNMSIDEYRELTYSSHQETLELMAYLQYPRESNAVEQINTRSELKIQKWYYAPTYERYFYIASNIEVISGIPVYDTILLSGDSGDYSKTPHFVNESTITTISSSRREVTVVFTATLYNTPGVKVGKFTLTETFRADGGDLYKKEV